MRSVTFGVAFGLLGLVAVACSADGNAAPGKLCTPAAYVFCRCQNRDEGTKLCNADGESFADCLPCDSSGTPPTGGGGNDGIGDHSATPDSTPITPEPDSGAPPEATDSGSAATEDAGPLTTGDASIPPTKIDAGSTKPPPVTPKVPPAAAHCVAMKNVAPRTEVQQIADNPPTAEGGTPENGVYVQTWAVSYTGKDGEQGGLTATVSQQSIEIMGDVGRYVYVDDNHPESSGGFRLTLSGAKVTIAYECPAAAPKTFSYEVDGDDLTLFDAKGARFFTRQTGAGK